LAFGDRHPRSRPRDRVWHRPPGSSAWPAVGGLRRLGYAVTLGTGRQPGPQPRQRPAVPLGVLHGDVFHPPGSGGLPICVKPSLIFGAAVGDSGAGLACRSRRCCCWQPTARQEVRLQRLAPRTSSRALPLTLVHAQLRRPPGPLGLLGLVRPCLPGTAKWSRLRPWGSRRAMATRRPGTAQWGVVRCGRCRRVAVSWKAPR